MDETGKDNVGFSLLTTENPLTVNNDDQEDQEAEEEQRRRQQELQSMMAYAFDDIGDEENSTMNSSFEQSVRNEESIQNYDSVSGHVFTSGHDSIQNSEINLDEQYRHADINSDQQNKVIYQIQEREIKRLTQELNTLQETKEKELTKLKRKILLMENDHNGTAISLKQCQDLLVEKKREIDEKIQEITSLKDKIDTLTISKRNVEDESQMWKTKFSELEQKMNLIDQGLYVPISERQIRNKYEHEISELQHALEQSQKNLEKANKAKAIAENETKELKQCHEMFAVEKDEEIHNLYSQLENSKLQCHNLTDRIDSLEKEYQNLTTILNKTKETESFQVSSSMKTIQAELKRSLEDQKLKRDEIIKIENQLIQARSTETKLKNHIAELKTQFEGVLKQKENDFTENERLANEMSHIKTKVTKLTDALEQEKAKSGHLENELQRIQSENNALTVELEVRRASPKDEQVQTSLLEPEPKRSSYEIIKINSELEMLRRQNEQLYQELEDAKKLKKDIETESLKKIMELQNEMQPKKDDKVGILEEENRYLKLQFANLQKEYGLMKNEEDSLKKQYDNYEKLCLELEKTCAEQKSKLYECHSKITELEGKLILKEKRDDLLDDLQQKALMFEEYIKTKTDSSTEKGVNTSIDPTTNQEKLLKVTQEKLVEVSTENAKLKEKIIFDRNALNELTDVWSTEITRLNKLVTELKSEIDTKNQTLERHQKTVTEEISQMSLLIQKLTEALQNKDKAIQDIQEQTRKQQEFTKGIQKNYQKKEHLLFNQFEQNMEEMKNRFLTEEQKQKMALEGFQKRCVNGLEDLNDKITKQMKYNNEKYDIETKIIEAYYDLIIQQAKTSKMK